MPALRPAAARAAAALALAAVPLAGCASTASGGASSPAASSASSSAPATGGPTASASATFDGVTVTGPLDRAPVFTIGDQTQTTSSLQVSDVVVGTGATASATSVVTVQYAARSAKTKRPFDSSWDRGTAFTYDPAKIAFKAFTEGVPGMKAGGRRIVVVPGALAFGPTPPASTGLGPDETLVYVVDLVRVGS